MQYVDASDKLVRYRQQIAELRGGIAKLAMGRTSGGQDFQILTTEGKVRLASFSATRNTSSSLTTSGAGCPNCTLWADGFNGILPHIENRAALSMASPADKPAAQQKFRAARGWQFRMVSSSTPALPMTWATTAPVAGSRRDSANGGKGFAAFPTPSSMRGTISARFGTSSTYCQKVPMAGNRNTVRLSLEAIIVKLTKSC